MGALNRGVLQDTLVVVRISVILDAIFKHNNIAQAIRLLAQTADVLRNHGAFFCEIDRRILPLIGQDFAKALVYLKENNSIEETKKHLERARETLLNGYPMTMGKILTQRRLKNADKDIGDLEKLPASVRWHIGKMLA